MEELFEEVDLAVAAAAVDQAAAVKQEVKQEVRVVKRETTSASSDPPPLRRRLGSPTRPPLRSPTRPSRAASGASASGASSMPSAAKSSSPAVQQWAIPPALRAKRELARRKQELERKGLSDAPASASSARGSSAVCLPISGVSSDVWAQVRCRARAMQADRVVSNN